MIKEKQNEFGERLKKIRELKGLTRTELAKLLNISYRTLLRWEKGESAPSIKELRELTRILEVPESYLLGKSDTLIAANTLETKLKRLPPEAKEELETVLDYLYFKYVKKKK